MRRILLSIVAAVSAWAFPALGQTYTFPSVSQASGTVVLSNSAKGAMTETVVVQDALYAAGLTMISIAKNTLATYGNYQYGVYYNSSLVPQFFKRNLTTGVIVKYTPSLPAAADDDVHRVPSIAVDKNGYIHLAYGMHNSALVYYRSNSAEDPSAFTARAMLGTNESSLTYPMFVTHPSTGELYFTARQGHQGYGITLFYHYPVSATVWEGATGTTAGVLFNGQGAGDLASTYLNGLPKWDAAGNLWWQWTLSADDSAPYNQYLVKWDGASFYKFSGAAQPIPATGANLTPVMTISKTTALSPQSDFAVSASGIFTIAYMRNDAAGNMQVYAGESSTGSFVEHQLTNNLNPTGVAGSLNPTVVVGAPFTYVLFSDVFSKERGIVAYQSSDNYASFNKFYPVPNFNPNGVVNADPQRLAAGIVSFPFIDANEPRYGASYVYASANNGDLGKLSVIDWTPSIDVGASKGTPSSLYGAVTIGATNVYTSNLVAARATVSASSGLPALVVTQIGGGDSIRLTGAGPASGSISTDGAPIYLQPNMTTVLSMFSTGAVSFGTATVAMTANAIGLSKMAASGTAPGAAAGKLELVCGSAPGTAKLVIYAGTSGISTTIVDPVGGGVTGC